jgi:hypothetical protein
MLKNEIERITNARKEGRKKVRKETEEKYK